MKQNYNQAINLSLRELMKKDSSVIVWGPGTNDPKRVFGTTEGLLEQFGESRCFDGAISESAYTGHALGLALSGKKPIIHYQRVDFAFMAWDQIVNNIAKWSTMFGKHIATPVILRAIVGRGWGQGQQHSQNPLRMLTSFPGLNIYTPVTPQDAFSVYQFCHSHSQPSLILEHRWLQGFDQEIDEEIQFEEIKTYGKGKDLTLISYSYGVIECIRAANFLKLKGIDSTVISINSFSANYREEIQRVFARPKNAIVFDLSWHNNSPLADALQLRETDQIKYITLPNQYSPTSLALTKDYYPTAFDIVKKVIEMKLLKPDHSIHSLKEKQIDQPLYDNLFEVIS